MGANLSDLYSRIRYRHFRVLMVGLAGAGKTTILYKWKTGEDVSAIPSTGFNVETIYHRNVALTIWDVSGQGELHRLWHQYINNDAPGIIFVVDSTESSPERIQYVRKVLHDFMRHDSLKDSVVLIIASKSDLPGAMSKDQVAENLMLRQLHQQVGIGFSRSISATSN
uniref:ADP-ribosylation factor 1-like 2 n=1 Tax=Steinernema glaseri TaxID=37863 RepID=A0A1I7ZA16_9BILA